MSNELKQLEVTYAVAITTGSGHKRVTVQLSFGDAELELSAITTDMQGIDKASYLEGQEKFDALYEVIETQIHKEVMTWIHSLNN